jgi:hypothetical protein
MPKREVMTAAEIEDQLDQVAIVAGKALRMFAWGVLTGWPPPPPRRRRRSRPRRKPAPQERSQTFTDQEDGTVRRGGGG